MSWNISHDVILEFILQIYFWFQYISTANIFTHYGGMYIQTWLRCWRVYLGIKETNKKRTKNKSFGWYQTWQLYENPLEI